MSKKKVYMDDGFNPEFVETARFDGILEIPVLDPPREFVIPDRMIPLTKLKRSENHSEIVVPYVYDSEFSDILRNPDKYVDELSKHPAAASLDNSAYVDSPLEVQIANVYRSRAIGHHLQKRGVNIIPNVRWGDERSYTTCVLPEKFAFLGLPKHSILSVGTYGACKTREEKFHLRNGFIAMLDELEPECVLIYGAMPKDVFFDLYDRTNFIQYSDWTSTKKRRAK
ncbi:MAG: DUF4417 domain-containing protein [Clostridia bacterium]|nr:DUF4417 domain-containing protein [Clostridia bacterium]